MVQSRAHARNAKRQGGLEVRVRYRHAALPSFGSRDAAPVALALPSGPLVAWLLAIPVHHMKLSLCLRRDTALRRSAGGMGVSRRGIHLMPSVQGGERSNGAVPGFAGHPRMAGFCGT
jgi:hypothetical protein